MKRGLQLILVGLFVVVVGAGVLAWVDPFGWHVWQRLRGGYDAAITAVPPHTAAYIGINLLNLDEARLGEIAGAFATAESDTPTSLDELDQQLVEALGISLNSDIMPWLGQYAGLAVLDVTQDEAGQITAEWVMAVESRDTAATDQFLNRFTDAWAAKKDLTAESQTYRGVALTVFDGLVFGRSGDLVLFGSSVEAMQEAIETQGEESLADMVGYTEAVSQLPNGRLLTFYLNAGRWRDLLAESAIGLSITIPGSFLSPAMRGTAVALSLPEAGIQLDTVTLYDPEAVTPAQQEVWNTPPNTETAAFFPADTLVFGSIPSLQVIWENYRAAFIAETSEADFAESMNLFADEFGLNPDTDLFPLLDGVAAFGAVPGGVLQIVGVEVDIAAFAHTIKTADLSHTLVTFSEKISDPQTGIGTVTPITGDDTTLYQLESVLFPDRQLVYGLHETYLLLGSDLETVQSLVWDGGASLASHPRYQQTWQAFPAEMSPSWYVDVTELKALSRSGEVSEPDTAWLDPISTIAAAGKSVENTTYQTIIVFIETAEP